MTTTHPVDEREITRGFEFAIDPASAEIRCIRFVSGGVRPATSVEIALWDALSAQPNTASQDPVAMAEPRPDWEAIAMQLQERLIFAINYGKFGSGFMLNMETMNSQNVKDYLADGLEMIPGVTVNRELMHMTPAQRRKATATCRAPAETKEKE